MPLQELDGKRLDTFYTELRTKAGRNGKGLAPATVRGIHIVLGRILKSAIKSRSISHNPIEDAETAPTAGQQDEITILEEAELAALLNHLRSHWLYLPTLLAASTGLRRGEILGLRWRELDTTQATLKVAQQAATIGGKVCLVRPKSARSRRTITLPASLIPELQAHKRTQSAWRLKYGLGKDPADLVFTNPQGEVVHPEGFTELFGRQTRAAGLGRVKFHSLRHLHITQLLRAGVPVHIVSARAGHARPSITLDLYSHVLSGDDATAAERADEALLRVLT